MDCREVCDKIYEYIEHQLSQKEIIEFEEHMKNCKHCQEEYYDLEKIIVRLKNIKDVEPPKDLKYKILDNIKKENKNKSKIVYWKRYSYAAVTISMLFGGMYMLKNINNTPIKNDIYTATKTSRSITNTETIIEENNHIPNVANEDNINENAIFNNSRSIDNSENKYLYDKFIKKENNINIFKHDIALNKNEVCNIYFENKSDKSINLYVEDIDGNKVSEDTIINGNSSDNIEFFILDENIEQNVYTVTIDGNGKEIEGYFKIEIMTK
ncbi:anti-sigma factor family protein [[Clostridium] colinum]|uniref:anti-sigma factor family protein n=1 Tax=[Clostridium] colinum TaxID=36835 RepID=UPI0020253AF7|nr:zf-HC2 domain-containing protein [[Clostridium] colinum]